MTLISKIRTPLKAAFIAAALTATLAAPAFSADFIMKLSTPTIKDMQHEWMIRFEKALEARTKGRIDVQLYPASQLGPIPSVIEGLQLGTIEATIVPSELYVGVDPRFQGPAIPGLFKSMADARAKLDDPKVRKHLLGIGEKKGLIGISLLVYGPQTIATRKDVKTLKDLSGLRIRVLASKTEIGTINALGAAAVPMPLTEVSAALQQRTIDGVSTVLDVHAAFRTNKVAPHVVRTGLWYLISLTTVSKVWFDKLPKDLQTAVLETAKELEHPMHARQLERDKANRKIWTSRGGTLVELSAEEQKTARERAAGVVKGFLKANPNMRETYDVIKNAGAK